MCYILAMPNKYWPAGVTVNILGIMINLRKSEDRGHANHGWLDTRFTFSFARYYDPEFMGFRSLRVLNDDRISPGAGFGEHPHDNMEIITYVLDGSLAHRDSTGSVSVITPGLVQRMSAGTGITHSEFNASKTDSLHLLQIWIEPDTMNIEPGYEEKSFETTDKLNRLRLIASPDGRDGSTTIRQDALVYATVLEQGGAVEYRPETGRHQWLHIATGDAELNGTPVSAGDGAAISDETLINLTGIERAELLLFDLD